MKNRLQKLIALGIVTVLAVNTVAFISQDSISGIVTIASETEEETESETDPPETSETDPAEGSEEEQADDTAGEPAPEGDASEGDSAPEETVAEEEPAPAEAAAEEEPAPEDTAAEEEPAPEGTAAEEEPAPEGTAAEEESATEETIPEEEPAAEDAGIVSSDWESATSDIGAVGEEIILDVDNDETDPNNGELLETDPEETDVNAEEPQEETPEETGQEETDAEDAKEEDPAAVNIIGFSVDPSQYPAADASANTRYIYNYLTKTMGFNHAAACGILANMQMESGFNPLALGDGGTSYGLCQWHNERFNSLISYCNSVGLDYNTLDGQLANLNRELTGAYSSIYSYIMSVPDTAQGAYDAGYYWCVYFEIPNNATSHGALRGNLASNEYYPLDLSMDDTEAMPVEDSIFLLREDMALQSEGWAVNTEEDGSVIFTFPEVVLLNKTE